MSSPISIRVQSDQLPWRPTPFDGVEWKKLRFDPDTGRSAVMLRFAPGATYGAHRHPGGEEYLVLEGNIEEGGQVWGAGSYICHPEGSRHAPRSPDGCLLFVLLPRPIELC